MNLMDFITLYISVKMDYILCTVSPVSSAVGSIPNGFTIAITVLLTAILLEVVNMTNKNIVNKATCTVMTNILVNLSTDKLKAVAPALG